MKAEINIFQIIIFSGVIDDIEPALWPISRTLFFYRTAAAKSGLHFLLPIPVEIDSWVSNTSFLDRKILQKHH